jgi:hydroxymethylbilane synthase
MARRIRIGSRGSPLALAQARETIARLTAANRWAEDEAAERLELIVVKTSGDKVLDRPLAEVGGKGLFVKELEEAMADGRVDIAVHSMKDVPGTLPDGFVIAAALPREDARDALIGAPSIAELPRGARVGTTSPRRAAQLLSLRPDLNMVLFRGNVQTRLDKLARGEAEATLLAMAGLHRLGLSPALAPLDPDAFIPAAGQGCIGLETRADDLEAINLASSIDHALSALALAAERACLAELDGSCRSAIAVHAREAGGGFIMRAAVFAPDGRERADAGETLAIVPLREHAEALGRELAARLKADAGHLVTP